MVHDFAYFGPKNDTVVTVHIAHRVRITHIKTLSRSREFAERCTAGAHARPGASRLSCVMLVVVSVSCARVISRDSV